MNNNNAYLEDLLYLLLHQLYFPLFLYSLCSFLYSLFPSYNKMSARTVTSDELDLKHITRDVVLDACLKNDFVKRVINILVNGDFNDESIIAISAIVDYDSKDLARNSPYNIYRDGASEAVSTYHGYYDECKCINIALRSGVMIDNSDNIITPEYLSHRETLNEEDKRFVLTDHIWNNVNHEVYYLLTIAELRKLVLVRDIYNDKWHIVNQYQDIPNQPLKKNIKSLVEINSLVFNGVMPIEIVDLISREILATKEQETKGN